MSAMDSMRTGPGTPATASNNVSLSPAATDPSGLPIWHDRIAPLRRKRQLIAELERLSGKKVLLQQEAA
jgi:hypothetical protein